MEKRLSSAPLAAAEVLSDVHNHVATVTLNRPAALNALSFGMIGELDSLLTRIAADAEIRAVLLRGAGEKSFCAGGDVRALYDSFKTNGTLHHNFFAAEYPLDFKLHAFPKPVIVLMDGITMGGGMGLAQGSRWRIVGERTRIAMPEVGIGLFPDVGASYFLSRLPGKLGLYLALSGTQIRGVDAVYAGLADVFATPAAIAAIGDGLASLAWGQDFAADVQRFVQALAAPELPPAPLDALRPAIDEHFSAASVSAILASLEAETREAYAPWAQQTAKLLRARSPTMLAVTFKQLARGDALSLAECFRMELGMVAQCFEQGDFIEGVRAVIVDKDNAPQWSPNRLDEVKETSVDAFFRNRWSAADHPLAFL